VNACAHCKGSLSRFDRACSFCGAPNPKPENVGPEIEGLMARGWQALQQGRPADAVEQLARAIELDPDVYDAYVPMTSAWQQLGNLARAIDYMMQARAIRPGSAPTHYNIGMLMAQQGQRFRARNYLWEAMRLAASDPLLASRQSFLDRVYDELERLGSITPEEYSQARPSAVDAQGHPRNPELADCLRALSGTLTRAAALAFHVAFVRSFLLVPETGDGPRDGVLNVAGPNAQIAVVVLTGPDGLPWFPAFTDAQAMSAFRPGTAVPYTALPGVAVAKLALTYPTTAGVVLNPTAHGAGQPFERKGLEPIAQGRILRLSL
jgi:hypothetical protein